MTRIFSRRVLLGGAVGAAIVAALALGAGGLGLWPAGGPRPPAFKGNIGPFVAHAAPKPAPAIGITDAAGKPTTLADFAGRVVLLNYWATWCAPCVEEMPALERLADRLGGNAAVLAVSVDRQGNALVEPFVRKLGLARLPIYLDPKGESMRALGVRGLPTTILFDREGREVGRLEGAAAWDSPEALALIRHYAGDRGADG